MVGSIMKDNKSPSGIQNINYNFGPHENVIKIHSKLFHLFLPTNRQM